MNDGRICGTGANCEQTCPLMKLGRDCPDPAEAIQEALAAAQPSS